MVFASAVSSDWNALSPDLHMVQSLLSFGSLLKCNFNGPVSLTERPSPELPSWKPPNCPEGDLWVPKSQPCPLLSHHCLEMDLSPPLESEPPGGEEGGRVRGIVLIMVTPATLPSMGLNGSKLLFQRLHVVNPMKPDSVNSVSHPSILSVSEVTGAEFSNFHTLSPAQSPTLRQLLENAP